MKRFVTRIIMGGIPLLVILAACVYYTIYEYPQLTGDLGRLGKIAFGSSTPYGEYNSKENLPPLGIYKMYHVRDSIKNFKIASIGDSFSRQGQSGFQNFLAQYLNEKILHIEDPNNTTSSPEKFAISLLNSGFFDTLSVKWLILESVERGISHRCLKAMDRDAEYNFPIFVEPRAAAADGIIKRSVKQGTDWILLKTGLASNPVRKAQLDSSRFTLDGFEDELYFYEDDLDHLSETPENIRKIFSTMDFVRAAFKEKGIELVYLVAPDKYDVYQPFIEDNEWPAKHFGEQLMEMEMPHYMLFPLDTMRRMVGNGVQDVYLANDSHWSHHINDLVARLVLEKMKELE